MTERSSFFCFYTYTSVGSVALNRFNMFTAGKVSPPLKEGLGRILSLGGRRPSPSFCEGFAWAPGIGYFASRGLLRDAFPLRSPRGPCKRTTTTLHGSSGAFFVCLYAIFRASPSMLTNKKRLQQKLKPCNVVVAFAERRGFEPLKHFWRLLTFQASQFNHSCTSPFRSTKVV